jgi:glycosyltransferase involved in cell wall biosynthesis
MIDVVLANYNHAHSITDAIQALNNQTLKPNKIYIFDDASTDSSWEKINEASKKYNNIVSIRNFTNEGANRCYNRGLELSSSDLIYFAAADDVTFPLLFEKCSIALKANPEAPFATAEALVFNATNKRFSMRPIIRPKITGRYMKPENIEREFKNNDNWIMTGACVYRTEFVRNAFGLNCDLGAFSDSFLAKKLAFKSGGIFLKYTGIQWNIAQNGFSRSIYSDSTQLTNLKPLLYKYVSNNKEFPIWYWDKFLKRLVFSEIRLGPSACFESIISLYETPPKYLFLIKRACRFNTNKSKTLVLLIFYLRFKPYPIYRILKTFLERSITKPIFINKTLLK